MTTIRKLWKWLGDVVYEYYPPIRLIILGLVVAVFAIANVPIIHFLWNGYWAWDGQLLRHCGLSTLISTVVGGIGFTVLRIADHQSAQMDLLIKELRVLNRYIKDVQAANRLSK